MKIIHEAKPLVLDQIHKEKKIPSNQKGATPSARKDGLEVEYKFRRIEGTGKNGLVLKEDIMNLMGTKPQTSERRRLHGPEERIKMTRLRATIAKRLKEAQQTAAMLTTFNEVDMNEVILMRNNYKEGISKKIFSKTWFHVIFCKSLRIRS